MTSEESTYQGPPDSDLVKAIAALMRECLEKVRQHDPPETWQDVYSRIEALRARLDYQPMADNQPAPGAVCTYCGPARQTVSLHVFDLCAPGSRWHLCDRCWRLLAIGFNALRPDVDLMEYLTRDFGVTDVMVRGYVRLGGALVQRTDLRPLRAARPS
jgi:hypothetical protein